MEERDEWAKQYFAEMVEFVHDRTVAVDDRLSGWVGCVEVFAALASFARAMMELKDALAEGVGSMPDFARWVIARRNAVSERSQFAESDQG